MAFFFSVNKWILFSYSIVIFLSLSIGVKAQNEIPDLIKGFIFLEDPFNGKQEYIITCRRNPEVSQKNFRIVFTPSQINKEGEVVDSVVWQGEISRNAAGFQMRNATLLFKSPNLFWIPESSWFDFERVGLVTESKKWSVEWLENRETQGRNWLVLARATGLHEGYSLWGYEFLEDPKAFSFEGLSQSKKYFSGTMRHNPCVGGDMDYGAKLVFGSGGMQVGNRALIYFDRISTGSVTGIQNRILMLLDVKSNKGDSLFELRPSSMDHVFFSGVGLSILNPNYRFQLKLGPEKGTITGRMRGAAGTTAVFTLNQESDGKNPDSLPLITSVTAQEKQAEISYDKLSSFEKLQLTKIDTIARVKANGDSIELAWYDNAQIDGDSISLFIDNKLVFEKELLSARPVKMILFKKDGNAMLIKMLAENLGSIPPNTAVLIIRDGNKTEQFNMKSDFKTTGSILVYW